jgi:hypothetical protein
MLQHQLGFGHGLFRSANDLLRFRDRLGERDTSEIFEPTETAQNQPEVQR